MESQSAGTDLFLGCSDRAPSAGAVVIVGCPLDDTSTYRRGSSKAPDAVRAASDSIETYSPLVDDDLEDSPCIDAGNLELPAHDVAGALERIERTAETLFSVRARPLFIGGEHTITLPVIRALNAVRDDFVVIHLDAHTDLREDYEGSPVNHATVMRRVADIIGADRLIQLGIRSGTRAEFQWMRLHGSLLDWDGAAEKYLRQRVRERAVYVTLDVDVLDPSCLPATGNPEAGGWTYRDMERFLQSLQSLQVLAADVVELNPELDPDQMSTITVAKIVRELLLILRNSGT